MGFPGISVPENIIQFWCMMVTDATKTCCRIKVNLVCITLHVIINSYYYKMQKRQWPLTKLHKYHKSHLISAYRSQVKQEILQVCSHTDILENTLRYHKTQDKQTKKPSQKQMAVTQLACVNPNRVTWKQKAQYDLYWSRTYLVQFTLNSNGTHTLSINPFILDDYRIGADLGQT